MSKMEKIKEMKVVKFFSKLWNKFKEKHPDIATFLVFFLSSNVVTFI